MNIYETISVYISPLSIGTISEKCMNCSALAFLVEHGTTKHIYCHYGKAELASFNYPKMYFFLFVCLLFGIDTDSMRTNLALGERM